VRGADEEAFRVFVRDRYAGLLRYAGVLTADRGHAEDLVQEALARAYGSWSRLSAAEAAESYTRTILVRLAVRGRRRRWRGEAPTDRPPERAQPAADPDLAESVRAALAALPAEQRTVLVLRYWEDRSEREIADLLDCPRGTVKSRAARALAALREAGLLDGIGPDDAVDPTGAGRAGGIGSERSTDIAAERPTDVVEGTL
jgi:RNA polymerase sigma-70 factor (sigma-E family)